MTRVKSSNAEPTLAVHDDGRLDGTLGDATLDAQLVEQATEALQRGLSRTVDLGGRSLFVEVYPVRPRLVVVGAVEVARSLVRLAKELGFETVVIDGRASFATAEVGAGLRTPYEQFLRLNDEFKRLCTDWQIRDEQPNDHRDADYDKRCIDALGSIASGARSVIDTMSATVPRLLRYSARLTAAERCVAAGEAKKFTGVMCESFHDVWMEFHEDLIVLQRIDRVGEGSF